MVRLESPQEFLARGGHVQRLPPGASGLNNVLPFHGGGGPRWNPETLVWGEGEVRPGYAFQCAVCYEFVPTGGRYLTGSIPSKRVVKRVCGEGCRDAWVDEMSMRRREL